MLHAVYELGNFLLNKENKSPLEILIENPDSNGTYKHIAVINLDSNYNHIDVNYEEFKGNQYYLYLYKKGSSRGTDYSPTARLAKSAENTIKQKITSWFKDHQNISDKFKNAYKSLTGNHEVITSEISEIKEGIPKKESLIITVKINGNYLYEIDNFQNLFKKDTLAKAKKISHENSICSICGKTNKEVFSTSDLFKFYTTDKECYITSGFNEKEAWKNFPVCEDCYLKINFGRKYIEENLKFKFLGKNYLLIPKILINTGNYMEELLDILENREDKYSIADKGYIADEEEILAALTELDDALSFYMLFIEKSNAAEKILLLTEEVLPSRFCQIFDAKKATENTFKHRKDDKKTYTLKKITDFIPYQNKYAHSFPGLFMEITDKIFGGGKLDRLTLIKIFNFKIREILNETWFHNTVQDALMNICFLEELNIINKEVHNMEKSKFDPIFEKAGSSLNTPFKRGVFLLGALTKILLNIQYKKRGSAPFFTKLKGLRMNETDMKGLLPGIINKLNEYNIYTKPKEELAKEISTLFLFDNNHKSITTDEINFYFAAGMALYEEVKKLTGDQQENEEEA